MTKFLVATLILVSIVSKQSCGDFAEGSCFRKCFDKALSGFMRYTNFHCVLKCAAIFTKDTNEFGYLADECLWLDNLIYCVEMWKKYQGADCEDPIKGQIEIRLKKGDAPKCFHDFVYGNYSSQILPSKKFLRRSKNKI